MSRKSQKLRNLTQRPARPALGRAAGFKLVRAGDRLEQEREQLIAQQVEKGEAVRVGFVVVSEEDKIGEAKERIRDAMRAEGKVAAS